MKYIPTVNGPVSADHLGYTLCHEHIFVHDEGVIANFPGVWDREKAIALARQKLTEAYNAGVRTIVDASILGNGRNIHDVMETVRSLPINVIACTGVFYPDRLPAIFQENPVFFLKDCFVKDITQGISGTDIKAGLIKVCTDQPGITPGVEKALRAAARAHLETGVPIHTHACADNRSGLSQQDILRIEGVDLSRVYIGHVIDTDNISYALRLLDAGSYIGFDRFAASSAGSPRRKTAVRMIAELCRRGYEDQILIGNDGCAYQTVDPNSESLNRSNDYLVFPIEIVPCLLEAGLSPSQLNKMTIENPQRLFS